MAIHKSAIKRHRQSLVRRERNKSLKSRMKTAVKSLVAAIDNKEKEQVQKTLVKTTSIIAKTASKGVIPKETARRKVSRLTKRANAVL